MKYYTYVHCTPDGEVFYVGKGTGGRVYSTRGRNIRWHEMVDAHDGIMMKIMKKFESEQDAFLHERELISAFLGAGAKLVNITSGGKGPKDYKQSPESRAKKSKRLRGYVHKVLECPHCKTVGGATAIKRWHFENCTGAHPKYKARVTIHGVRRYLGKFHTEQEVASAIVAECKKEGVSVPLAFRSQSVAHVVN
jgi:hypothetical protein